MTHHWYNILYISLLQWQNKIIVFVLSCFLGTVGAKFQSYFVTGDNTTLKGMSPSGVRQLVLFKVFSIILLL